MFFNLFQVFHALAVNHPATAVTLSNVADGKQLLNINDWQRRIVFLQRWRARIHPGYRADVQSFIQ
jgi:hypothetical protein